MFYYFGRKKRLASLYPEPVGEWIIEPFAGSGAYSLHGDRWRRNVWLNDLDPNVIDVWKYLQAASPEQIEALPNPEPGSDLRDFVLSDEERRLISWHAGPGKNRSNFRVSKFSRWSAGQRYIAANLHKIRHWTISCQSYESLPDVEATWFVDPPYQQHTGRLYAFSSIDFGALRAWCEERRGLVVVCEQEGADWLPFVPLASQTSGRHVSHEVVWIDDPYSSGVE